MRYEFVILTKEGKSLRMLSPERPTIENLLRRMSDAQIQSAGSDN